MSGEPLTNLSQSHCRWLHGALILGGGTAHSPGAHLFRASLMISETMPGWQCVCLPCSCSTCNQILPIVHRAAGTGSTEVLLLYKTCSTLLVPFGVFEGSHTLPGSQGRQAAWKTEVHWSTADARSEAWQRCQYD